MADDVLTLRAAAELLGVHYMTAYRYVRLGLLDAEKRGGTWHVSVGAVEAFRSGGSGTAPVDAGARAPWAGRMESRLVAGDAGGAWGVVEAAMAAGAALDEIYLEVLTPALVSIGERWSRGELDIAIEHRASGVAMRLMGQMGPRFVRRGRPRGTIVLAAPAGEDHALPVAMFADLLRLEGWNVSDLGADLPGESLAVVLRTTPDAVAVGLSVTSDLHLDSLTDACRIVRSACPDVLVVVGGRAIRDRDHARSLGAHEHASGGPQMTALVEAHLAARPAPE